MVGLCIALLYATFFQALVERGVGTRPQFLHYPPGPLPPSRRAPQPLRRSKIPFTSQLPPSHCTGTRHFVTKSPTTLEILNISSTLSMSTIFAGRHLQIQIHKLISLAAFGIWPTDRGLSSLKRLKAYNSKFSKQMSCFSLGQIRRSRLSVRGQPSVASAPPARAPPRGPTALPGCAHARCAWRAKVPYS